MGPRLWRLAMVVTVLVSAAGCGSSSTTPTSQLHLAARLDNVPTGTAKLSFNAATRRISLHIDVFGLTPDSVHAVHIHHGSCLAPTSKPLVSFPDITSDGAGDAKADVTATQPTPGGLPSDAYIDVHLVGAAELAAASAALSLPIACSDVPAKQPAPVVRLFANPGHKPFGTATATYDASGRSLTVHLVLGALPPRTAHAVFIHAGSCQVQGPVKYGLTDVTADDRGSADVNAALGDIAAAPPATGWYLTVHVGASSEILANGKPAALYQPALCGDFALAAATTASPTH